MCDKLSTDPHVKVSGLPEAIVKAREDILELLDTKVECLASSASICAVINIFPFSLSPTLLEEQGDLEDGRVLHRPLLHHWQGGSQHPASDGRHGLPHSLSGL